jgi:hypothetical protein
MNIEVGSIIVAIISMFILGFVLWLIKKISNI